MEKLGMAAALAGAALVAGFIVCSSIWPILFGDELPIIVRVGIGLGGFGILVLFAAVVRKRLKERSDEDLGGIQP